MSHVDYKKGRVAVSILRVHTTSYSASYQVMRSIDPTCTKSSKGDFLFISLFNLVLGKHPLHEIRPLIT